MGPQALRETADTGAMRRVPALIVVLAALCGALPSTTLAARGATDGGAVAPPASWAAAQIERVVKVGVLAPTPEAFRPDDPITAGELFEALDRLGLRATRPPDPARPLTVRELDARLVGVLGLTPAARRIRLAAKAAGLRPPSWLGTETVARLLGLRLNHPFGEDALEPGVNDPVSRAEAAYSLSVILSFSPATLERVDQLTTTFAPPQVTSWQQAVLSRAVQFVGSPYVWTGTSERPQLQWTADGLSQQPVPGGFDCSGFVWRVYKLKPFAGAPALGTTLGGRTTFEMSAEMRARDRVAIDALQPGDLVFFGAKGPKSKPAEIDHMGIALGNGWFAHSSRTGVTLQPFDGWYTTAFAWGRRPLAEAGLA
jgi:cell wall-associated NlpC family hydrolase